MASPHEHPDHSPANAASAAAVRDWPAYYDRVAGKPARDTLLEALGAFEAESNTDRFAIDLGCGEGRDTLELLRRGWRVLAIDGHPEGIARLKASQELQPDAPLECAVENYGERDLPRADLVNASFALPFCPPDRFREVWAGIVRAIRPGGRFAGQFFGDRDSWAIIEDRTHLTRGKTVELFDGFILESFREEERPGEDCHAAHKHWHVFHIVARKQNP